MANETIEVLRIPGTLFPRGAFDENASYKFLNFVESGGNGYVCLQPCTGIPVTNTAYWFKFVFKGEKGDAFTYADLTAEQKAELVRDATAAAQAAASSAQSAADDAAAVLQKFNTIKAAIDAIDPQSAEGSIQTLAAKQGLLEADLNALGPKIDQIEDVLIGNAIGFEIGRGGHITFDAITLSEDGDSIEFDVKTPVSTWQYDNGDEIGGGYNFTKATNIGLGITKQGYCLRADNGTWVAANTSSLRHSFVNFFNFKVLYESGNVLFYLNGELLKTYTGQETVTISGFGGTRSTADGWQGFVKNVKYTHSGVTTDLVDFSNLEYDSLCTTIRGTQSALMRESDVVDSLDNELANKPLSANMGKVLKESIDGAEERAISISNAVSPIVNAVRGLDWKEQYSFNGTSSGAVLSSPITLSEDGDSLEIEFGNIVASGVLQYKGYCFASEGHGSWRGIGIIDNQLSIRSTDLTWLFQNKAIQCSNSRLKIAFENSVVNLYLNDTLVGTYNGQKTIIINRIGDAYQSSGSSITYYWEGTIKGIKVNGTAISLSNVATLSNVTITAENSFLSPSEKAALGNLTNDMYVEKDGTSLNVYVKRDNGSFILYPLTHNTSDATFYDVWGVRQVKLATIEDGAVGAMTNLFAPSEAELAMYIRDGESSYYVGGIMHGYENVVGGTNAGGDGTEREVRFEINGQSFGESDTISLRTCQKVEVYQHTYLYPNDAAASPFATVIKHWVWTRDGMSITTSMTMLTEKSFINCYMGMMGVYRRWLGSTSNDYLTNKAVKDNQPFTIYDMSDGWSSSLRSNDQNCRQITTFGNMGIGFRLEITDTNLTDSGMMCWHNNRVYNKIYYGMEKTTPYPFSGEWHATQTWRIM